MSLKPNLDLDDGIYFQKHENQEGEGGSTPMSPNDT